MANRGVMGVGGSQGLGMSAQGGLPDIDPSQINALLSQFGGMSIPDHPQPQGLFENASWMHGAPGVAHGLDNALIALSNMGPSSLSAGDNISNVARGLSAIGPTRNAQSAAQYQMPLMMAGEVAKLQTAQSEMGRNAAMAGYYGGRNDSAEAVATTRAQGANQVALTRAEYGLRGREIAATKEARVVTGPDGKQMVGNPVWDADQGLIYKPDPTIDVKAFQAEKTKSAVHGLLGNSLDGIRVLGAVGMPPDMSDIHAPGNAKWWKGVNSRIDQIQSMKPNIFTGAAANRQTDADWIRNSDTNVKAYQDAHGAESKTRIATRVQAMQSDPKLAGLDYGEQMRIAGSEEQMRSNQLQDAVNAYKQLQIPQQKQVGGVSGWLQKRGYDPATRGFTRQDTTQDTSAAGNTGNAMGTQQTAPGPKLSPNVQAIIDSLRK